MREVWLHGRRGAHGKSVMCHLHGAFERCSGSEEEDMHVGGASKVVGRSETYHLDFAWMSPGRTRHAV